jgi:hypothetical protein
MQPGSGGTSGSNLGAGAATWERAFGALGHSTALGQQPGSGGSNLGAGIRAATWERALVGRGHSNLGAGTHRRG